MLLERRDSFTSKAAPSGQGIVKSCSQSPPPRFGSPCSESLATRIGNSMAAKPRKPLKTMLCIVPPSLLCCPAEPLADESSTRTRANQRPQPQPQRACDATSNVRLLALMLADPLAHQPHWRSRRAGPRTTRQTGPHASALRKMQTSAGATRGNQTKSPRLRARKPHDSIAMRRNGTTHERNEPRTH